MKTNIIHVLILAIVLIAGWSLFTVLQDLYNADALKYDNYSVLGKGKQYLPVTPEAYSRQQKYPVYKVPTHIQEKINQSQSTHTNVSYQVIDNGLSVNTNYNNSATSNPSNQGGTSAYHSIQMTKNSSIDNNKTSKSISNNRKMNGGGDLDKTTTYNGNIGSSFSNDNRVMRALRSAIDGNTIERSKRKGNKDPYNSVPVGDGLYLLMLMGALYSLFKIYKK